MRLWHSKLIPLLDGRRLCDLHMSCCNLRGKGWGKPNKSINYIYDDPLGEDALAVYHLLVLRAMHSMGYDYDDKWEDPDYCGKNREARQGNYRDYYVARRRNIPLKGHTLQMYLNDVKALQERGLDIKLDVQQCQDSNGSYTLYRASRNGITTYAAF